jgi:hypothetical protein
MFHNPMDLHGLLQGWLYLFFFDDIDITVIPDFYSCFGG